MGWRWLSLVELAWLLVKVGGGYGVMGVAGPGLGLGWSRENASAKLDQSLQKSFSTFLQFFPVRWTIFGGMA